uniref:Monoacylglycerol O-acyltransferase 3b n=1 Tax=Cyclopterus lumpus TaxID=8103 RepID=A0A8C3AWT1_CYCLU
QVAGMTKEKTQWKQFLETVSTLQWVLCFLILGVSCIILMVCLMFTSLWPLSTLYFIMMHYTRKWRSYSQLEIIKTLVKTAELNPNQNYILGCHPHGIMSAGAFACFSTESCGFAEVFPGMRNTLVVLAGLFRIPILRDYLMCGGLCPVSKPSLVHLLSKRGKGNAVVIVIGGAAESLASSPGVNVVVMRQRKGFVRWLLSLGESTLKKPTGNTSYKWMSLYSLDTLV